MSIAAIPEIKLITPAQRAYDCALDFVVATASIGAYLNALHGQTVSTFAPTHIAGHRQYPTMTFAGIASGKNLEIVPHDVLTNVLGNDTRAGDIAFLTPASFPAISGNSTGAAALVLEGCAQAMFTRYWEDNLSSIEATHGKRKNDTWPAVLQFAAVVRDAMSHRGALHMSSHVPQVSFFNLTYAHAQNGRRITHNDLSCADIFFLMLDADLAY